MRQLAIATGLVAGLAMTAAPAAAQAGWQEPECELSTGHYLLNSAQLYLKNAATTAYADQRERDLRDAIRVLRQALDQGRDDDPAVWYFLARWYKVHDDLEGMDSAFTRAQALKPDCTDDIQKHRRQVWVPILNRGVDAMGNNNMAAAKEAFRRANMIYDREPLSTYYMAQVFAQEGAMDSAVAYYRTAIEIADGIEEPDDRTVEIQERSLFNVARLFHREEQYDSAAAWYQRFLELDPNDAQALTGLASAYSASGNLDAAVAIYDTVLARADSLPPFDLLQAGIALFNADRYARAATAFEKALERNQYYRQRETLFNLANTYLSLGNQDTTRAEEMAQKMQPIAERLVEVDPGNRAAKRLLAAAYQLRGDQDSTLVILEQAQEQQFDVTVSTFAPAGDNLWDVRGIVTNNADSGAVETPDLVFEFIDGDGNVVSSHTVPSQTLEDAGVVPFRMAAQGEGIVAWQYRIGSAQES